MWDIDGLRDVDTETTHRNHRQKQSTPSFSWQRIVKRIDSLCRIWLSVTHRALRREQRDSQSWRVRRRFEWQSGSCSAPVAHVLFEFNTVRERCRRPQTARSLIDTVSLLTKPKENQSRSSKSPHRQTSAAQTIESTCSLNGLPPHIHSLHVQDHSECCFSVLLIWAWKLSVKHGPQ